MIVKAFAQAFGHKAADTGKYLRRGVDAQNALYAANEAVYLVIKPVFDVTPHSGDAVFQTLNDVFADAAPVVLPNRVSNGRNNTRDSCNQFRDCPDDSGNQRYNDLRCGKDNLIKVINNAVDKRNNQCWNRRHQFRDALNNSVNQRKQQVNSHLNNVRQLYNDCGKQVANNQRYCRDKLRNRVNQTLRKRHNQQDCRFNELRQKVRACQHLHNRQGHLHNAVNERGQVFYQAISKEEKNVDCRLCDC